MLKEKIEKIIKESVENLQKKGEIPEINLSQILVEKPNNKNYGDYSSNIALQLAKSLQKNPREIAELIGVNISHLKSNIFEKIETGGIGFINFWLKNDILEKMFQDYVKKGPKFFQKKLKNKETIVIEYSSPNIAKPLGVHHLRSTIIGQALVNILRFYGHKVISLSFPGDWGTQFGFLIASYKRWGSKEKIKKEPIKEMLRLYVRFCKEAKKNPELIKEGREEFKKLEEGNTENRKIWKWFKKESLKDFDRLYKLLDVKIENTIGESFYEKELKKLVANALKRGVAKQGQDKSIVIEIPDSSVPEIIQKSDGTTIYTTRELAAISHRLKKWRANKILYVAANQQTFHLSQVFKAAEKLGIAKKGQLVHIKFGMMLGAGGKKFATREGRLIPLEDVLKEAVLRAKKIVEELNPSLPEKIKEEISQKVGIGAVKFFDLYHNRLSDIVFDWEKMLNLKGFSAPYIQYTFARFNSILKKAGFKKPKNPFLAITEPLEKEIVAKIVGFDEIIEKVAENYCPDHLAVYLYDLAKDLNLFYEKFPVIKAKSRERESRLNLVFGAKEILKTGLELLGIKTPDKM